MKKKTKWTTFWDMHSGGRTKEPPYDKIYIEAPRDEAEIFFYNRFGHNPNRVTCTCCGADYSIDVSDSLAEASAYHRGCKWIDNKYIEEPSEKTFSFNRYKTLKEYLKDKTVLVIRSKDIKPYERKGEMPEQGYVWVD